MPFSADLLPSSVSTLPLAYDACAKLAREHYENFPVASFWLPKEIRPAVAAVYAFARCADDFADEPGLTAPDRLSRLADWRRRLEACLTDHRQHPVFWALADVFSRHRLPKAPFENLLTAFEMDVQKARHATFDDLLYYCGRSANPVGEILLRLFGAWTEPMGRWSDAICTGLQLANFWQDVTVDALKGRLYIPLEDLAARGLSEQAALQGPATEALRDLMGFQVRRTRTIFAEGRALADQAPAPLRRELRFVWLGGMEILNKIERQGFDVWSRRPSLGAGDWARLVLPWLFWKPVPLAVAA
ncbi:MAG: squalene synthase HpnC [Elusimicrobia bacterium]|nr:squalene synthase HpnC [Elusimicrobiota bacterium]